MVIVVLVVGFGVYRFRIKTLRRDEREFVRIVDDRTKHLQLEIGERKRIEEELLILSSRYEAMLASIPDIIMEVDNDKVYRWGNPAGIEFFGEDVIGKDAEFYFEGEQETYQIVQSLFNGDENIVYVESWQRRKDGEKRLLAWWCRVLKDENGNVTGALSTARDITERKRAEEVLRETEKNFRLLFEQNLAGVYHTTLEGVILDCNDAFITMLGYNSLEELRVHLVTDLYFNKTAREDFISYLRSHGFIKNSEIALRRKDGTILFALESATFVTGDRDSLPSTILGTIIDITESKQAEEAQREIEERYQRLVEFSPDAIAVHSDGKFLYVNPAAIKLIGAKDASELIGKPFLDIVHPDYKNAVNKRIMMGMEEGKTLPLIEEKFLRLDGGVIDVEVTSLPIVLKGKPAMQVVASDITERKKLRIELLQSQKMQSIGTLAGGIAHDFNNILGIILGYTGLLNKHKLDDQKFTESLSAITQTVQRGAALVRQILTFARKTDILFEPINLIDLAHELFSMLKQTFPKIITVQEVFAEDLPYIHADHTQIHQALLNLCVNARDAMPKGGTITFKAEKQPREQVQERFPTADQDSYICISVTDTGEGMDELTRLRIFDPFFTTKPLGRGTGMGLSVVYGVIQAHHGFINVESQLGRGTTFRLYFPVLTINEKDVQPQMPTESFAIGGTETILFVEDEDLLVETVCIFLESKGYVMHIA
ncbi:MAG: PAS domain S-box protein [Bacteroidota bacterium]|jgi:two-component system cell cycle sensor histidine kinase/response regulator CckA